LDFHDAVVVGQGLEYVPARYIAGFDLRIGTDRSAVDQRYVSAVDCR
jgi:hypothetical protein